MYKIVSIDIGRSKEILQKIKKYARLVKKELRADKVILFGSFARGDINEGSDIDILVIAPFKEPFLARIGKLLDINDKFNLPIEPLGYTPGQIKAMKKRKNPFIMKVLKEGRVLA
jgi:predicted nucleotidyltransferase